MFIAAGKPVKATPALPTVAMQPPFLRTMTALLGVQKQGPTTHSSEPILFSKLRIYSAEFPYLHSSNDQRLLT